MSAQAGGCTAKSLARNLISKGYRKSFWSEDPAACAILKFGSASDKRYGILYGILHLHSKKESATLSYAERSADIVPWGIYDLQVQQQIANLALVSGPYRFVLCLS